MVRLGEGVAMRLCFARLEGKGGDRILDVRGVAVVLPAVAAPGVEEDDFLGVNLGAVAPLPVVALPGVLGQASGDVMRSPLPTYSFTASACLPQQTTLCQSASTSPSWRRRSVVSRSWVTAVPFGVYFISGSVPTLPKSSTLLMVRAISIPPAWCGAGFAAPC